MRTDMEPVLWAQFPQNQESNYTHDTIQRIKEGGDLKWLCSLPMYEYAYVLVVQAALRYGGDLNPFISDLYKTRMNPILKAYYDKLITYRIHRAILIERNASEQHYVTDKSLADEMAAMRVYTRQTRRALKNVVTDFIEQRNDPTIPARALADTLPEAFPDTGE